MPASKRGTKRGIKNSKEIQLKLDSMQETIDKKKERIFFRQQNLDELQAEFNNLLEIAEKSEILGEAIITKMEKKQIKINEIYFQIEQLKQEINIDDYTGVVYNELSMETKKSLVNKLIDRVLLIDENELTIRWNI